jgi:gluconolactonase
MIIEVRHPSLYELIRPDAELELLASRFQFTEGPIWHPLERHLTFSDIPGDAMYRWSEEDGVQVFRRPSHKANGNAYDLRGCILTCEHLTSRLSRTNLDGSYEILASHFEGKELNSPNDVVVKSDGTLYFTDPPFGRINARVGELRPLALGFCGVYRLDPATNALSLLVDDFDRPNGLCFSTDEHSLFVNDSAHNHIRSFNLQDDGTLSNGRVWAQLVGEGVGPADGLKIDSEGNVYCTGPGGIHILDATANYLGVLQMPAQTANLCFGDDDLCSLYITASDAIYRLRVCIPGQSLWLAE